MSANAINCNKCNTTCKNVKKKQLTDQSLHISSIAYITEAETIRSHTSQLDHMVNNPAISMNPLTRICKNHHIGGQSIFGIKTTLPGNSKSTNTTNGHIISIENHLKINQHHKWPHNSIENHLKIKTTKTMNTKLCNGFFNYLQEWQHC